VADALEGGRSCAEGSGPAVQRGLKERGIPADKRTLMSTAAVVFHGSVHGAPAIAIIAVILLVVVLGVRSLFRLLKNLF